MTNALRHRVPSTTVRGLLGLAVALALVAGACGSDNSTSADGGPADAGNPLAGPDGPVAVTVTASDVAFDVDRIDARAGQRLTVTFVNEDERISHNFHVRAGDLDERTDITAGPDTQTLAVTIDEPGSYRFFCDVHPDMAGALVVA